MVLFVVAFIVYPGSVGDRVLYGKGSVIDMKDAIVELKVENESQQQKINSLERTIKQLQKDVKNIPEQVVVVPQSTVPNTVPSELPKFEPYEPWMCQEYASEIADGDFAIFKAEKEKCEANQ